MTPTKKDGETCKEHVTGPAALWMGEGGDLVLLNSKAVWRWETTQIGPLD